MSKLYVQYPYSNPELWWEGTTEECEKVISDYEQRVPDYFSDANYVWIEEDDEFEDDTVNKDRSRGVRRKTTENKKAYFRAIEPLTDSIRITRNGGVLRRGNTYEWHPVWKKMNIRLERHSGKSACRNYMGYEEERW